MSTTNHMSQTSSQAELRDELRDKLQNELRERHSAVRARVDAAALACGRAPESIELIAVSKTQSVEVLQAALDVGLRSFGENYAQEIRDKIPQLSSPSTRDSFAQSQWCCRMFSGFTR
jgi:hypothetical protein